MDLLGPEPPRLELCLRLRDRGCEAIKLLIDAGPVGVIDTGRRRRIRRAQPAALILQRAHVELQALQLARDGSEVGAIVAGGVEPVPLASGTARCRSSRAT